MIKILGKSIFQSAIELRQKQDIVRDDGTVASNDTKNYYVIEKGIFAYNPSRLNVGSLALKDNEKVSLVSPLYECFTTNQNKSFLYEWFNSKEF